MHMFVSKIKYVPYLRIELCHYVYVIKQLTVNT